MSSHADLWLFASLVFGVVILPGMDMAFVAGSAVTAGRRAGLAAVAGILFAGQLHLLAALSGLAALLAWWPGARLALLLASAGYMAWIGWGLLRPAPPGPGQAQASLWANEAPATIQQTFMRAAATCLMNPKAYAFTLAILPAFIPTPGHSLLSQAAWLGAIIAANQALVYGAVALLAAGARPWLVRRQGARRWTPRLVGAMLIAVACLVLLQSARAAVPPAAPVSSPGSPLMNPSTTPVAELATAAAHDFDFLIGRWRGHNRKLREPLSGRGAQAADWEAFETELETTRLPDGVGNADRFIAPAWRPGYVGSTLRVFDPRHQRWSLYSYDTRGNGFDAQTSALLAPVVGRFTGEEGVFEGPDEFHGRPIRVRYHWQRQGPDRAVWSQFFSADAGRTWELNWRCEHQRLP